LPALAERLHLSLTAEWFYTLERRNKIKIFRADVRPAEKHPKTKNQKPKTKNQKPKAKTTQGPGTL
jgi:hypothetical protein